MRYVGGKGRIARAIVDIIAEREPAARIAVEPFMGGGAITAELAQRFDEVAASDAHLDIALLWQAVAEGWHPPSAVSESDYRALRNAEPSALRGFVGSGGSFGGKWFGGYARGGFNGETPRNHQGESARAVERIGGHIRSGRVTVTHGDYREARIPDGAVVYCDPPYFGTQGYESGAFDHVEFWSWAELVSDRAAVYVSEYRAPSWWSCIWSKEKRQSVTLPEQGRELRIERLFALERS